MKLKNLKAQFRVEKEFKFKSGNHNFKIEDVSCTVYPHSKNVIHVTGIKSFFHLNQCKEYIKRKFNLISYKIDNQFFSHKGEKHIDLHKVYLEMMKNDDGYKISYEPELSNYILIKHYIKSYPTALCFSTGSYQIMGGKLKYVSYISSFVNKYIQV